MRLTMTLGSVVPLQPGKSAIPRAQPPWPVDCSETIAGCVVGAAGRWGCFTPCGRRASLLEAGSNAPRDAFAGEESGFHALVRGLTCFRTIRGGCLFRGAPRGRGGRAKGGSGAAGAGFRAGPCGAEPTEYFDLPRVFVRENPGAKNRNQLTSRKDAELRRK